MSQDRLWEAHAREVWDASPAGAAVQPRSWDDLDGPLVQPPPDESLAGRVSAILDRLGPNATALLERQGRQVSDRLAAESARACALREWAYEVSEIAREEGWADDFAHRLRHPDPIPRDRAAIEARYAQHRAEAARRAAEVDARLQAALARLSDATAVIERGREVSQRLAGRGLPEPRAAPEDVYVLADHNDSNDREQELAMEMGA